jgi:hypothetical protein
MGQQATCPLARKPTKQHLITHSLSYHIVLCRSSPSQSHLPKQKQPKQHQQHLIMHAHTSWAND